MEKDGRSSIFSFYLTLEDIIVLKMEIFWWPNSGINESTCSSSRITAPMATIGTASDSGNNATSLWSNLAEKYKKMMLRSQTHAIEATGIDDIDIVVEVTNAMPSATDRNCNWQLSNAAVEIMKSMPSRTWSVTFQRNTHENIQERSNPRNGMHQIFQGNWTQHKKSRAYTHKYRSRITRAIYNAE